MELTMKYMGVTVELDDNTLNAGDIDAMVALVEHLHDTQEDRFTAHRMETQSHRWHYCDQCLRSEMDLLKLTKLRHNLIERWEEVSGAVWNDQDKVDLGKTTRVSADLWDDPESVDDDPFAEVPAARLYRVVSNGTATVYRCNRCYCDFLTLAAIDHHVANLDAECDGDIGEYMRGIINAREDSKGMAN